MEHSFLRGLTDKDSARRWEVFDKTHRRAHYYCLLYSGYSLLPAMKLCLILSDQSRRATVKKIGEFIAVKISPTRHIYVWKKKFWTKDEIADFNKTADMVCRQHISYGNVIMPFAIAEEVAIETLSESVVTPPETEKKVICESELTSADFPTITVAAEAIALPQQPEIKTPKKAKGTKPKLTGTL
jgi:hypothetical protein